MRVQNRVNVPPPAEEAGRGAQSQRPRGPSQQSPRGEDIPGLRARGSAAAAAPAAPRASVSKLADLGREIRHGAKVAGTSTFKGAKQASTVAYKGAKQASTVAYKGAKQASTVAYKGAKQAGTAAFKGAKQALKWIDRHVGDTPRSRTYTAPEMSDEERYYGVVMSNEAHTEARRPTVQWERPARATVQQAQYRERPMNEAERRSHEASADYHNVRPSYPPVREKVRDAAPEQAARRPSRPEPQRMTREEAAELAAQERADHQDALDNGYY